MAKPTDESSDLQVSAPKLTRAKKWRVVRKMARGYAVGIGRVLGVAGIGGAAATGFQPLMLWPLTLAAFAWLIDRIERAPSTRRATLIAWLFGVGHFTIGNTWIATAFTYQAQMPAWLGYVAVVLLALYLAIYPALATFAARTVAKRTGAALLPTFAAFWIVAEWLRGWVFTGFPWNPLGVVALGPFDRPGLAQVAAFTGTYALSGVVILLAGQWLFGWRRLINLRKTERSPRTLVPALVHAAVPVALLLLPLHGDTSPGMLPFTLVQPDLRQDEINDPTRFEAQFRNLAALSLPRRPGQRRVVLWPEGAVPDFLRSGYPRYWYESTTLGADPVLARTRLGWTVGQNSLLLTGTTDLELRHTGPQADPNNATVAGAWNVVTVLEHTGAIRGSYAKAHLVPYGEYLPLRDWLEPLGLSRLVSGNLDFLSGPGPRTLDFGDPAHGGWGRIGMQICYEIVFSGHVIDRAHRPDFLFNPSNDGWFGPSGPPQHLAQARLRAIEEGVPILRSTTTGISAVIDASGGVRAFAAPHRAQRIDALVPPVHAATLFARFGNQVPLGWAVALLAIALVATRRRLG